MDEEEEDSHYYRCVVGRSEKLNWCGHWLVEKNMALPGAMKDLCVNLPVPTGKKGEPVKEAYSVRENLQSGGTVSKPVEPDCTDKRAPCEKVTEKKEATKPKCDREINITSDTMLGSATSDTMNDCNDNTKTPPKQMMSFSEISRSAKAASRARGVDSDDDCMIVDSPAFSSWRQRTEPARNVDSCDSVPHPRLKGVQVIPVGGAPATKAIAKTQVITISDSTPSAVSESSGVADCNRVANQTVPGSKLNAPSHSDVNGIRPLSSTSSMVSIVKPCNSSQHSTSGESRAHGGVGVFDMNSYIRMISEKERLTGVLAKQSLVLRTANLRALPDGGSKLHDKIAELTNQISCLDISIKRQQQVAAANKAAGVSVASMAQIKPRPVAMSSTQLPAYARLPIVGQRQGKMTEYAPAVPLSQYAYEQMYAAQAAALYGGRMTAARLREVGHVTTEALERLHIQLESLPAPDREVDDPAGLTVRLMMHQRQALTWLTWREKQHPPGGILADDMGLGKTLTMISLVLKQREAAGVAGKTAGKEKKEEDEWLARNTDSSMVQSDSTLVVCPASLVHQWAKEIEKRCDRRLLKVVIYHGPNRETDVFKLARADIVLTTYNIVSKEVGITEDMKTNKRAHEMPATDADADGATAGQSKLLRVAWARIVLDEAHSIKNHKSLTAMAMCRLKARSRWALTGTPIQNDLLDMYSLLRFLHCSPFDEYKLWKRQVDNKSEKGTKRLNMLVKTLLLRRTKNQTDTGGKPLVDLPNKQNITHELELSAEERIIYEKIFAQSRTTIENYIRRHEDRDLIGASNSVSASSSTNPWSNDDTRSLPGQPRSLPGQLQSSEIGVRPLLKQSTTQNGGSQMLLLLLRLRQCCCHLSLMRDALDAEALQADGLDLDIVNQMKDMALKETLTSLSDPDIVKKLSAQFDVSYPSTKIAAVMKELKLIREQSPKDRPMKSVIVSQWTSMLSVMQHHLSLMGLRCCTIRGDVPALKRMQLVEAFNTDPDGPQVMLVSLRAGGCGLNLIGGNHLFMVDLHWNPALETQACDRVYRIGQKREVVIHKFLCKDTVEGKIAELQKRKMALAHNVLTGAGAAANKLTLADLKMLFGLDLEQPGNQARPFGPVRL